MAEQTAQTNIDLSNYIKRRDAGLISWRTNDAGQVVLVLKQFDSAQQEIAPLEVIFSSNQLKKLRNARATQVLQMRDQILDIEEQIAAITRDDETLYIELEKDVKAQETGEGGDANAAPA